MSSSTRRFRLVRRRAVRLSVLVAGLLVGASGAAQDYAGRDVGDWTVRPSEDGKGCFLTRVYQGPGTTTLLLGLDVDGSNRLSLLNGNWSIRPKDRHSLTFRLSNVAFPRHLAVGIVSDSARGFVTSFGAKFPAHFASSAFLHVFRGEVPVERLDLRGSGAAVAELRRCVEIFRWSPGKVRRDEGARTVPIDPFATDAGDRPKK